MGHRTVWTHYVIDYYHVSSLHKREWIFCHPLPDFVQSQQQDLCSLIFPQCVVFLLREFFCQLLTCHYLFVSILSRLEQDFADTAGGTARMLLSLLKNLSVASCISSTMRATTGVFRDSIEVPELQRCYRERLFDIQLLHLLLSLPELSFVVILQVVKAFWQFLYGVEAFLQMNSEKKHWNLVILYS